MATDIVMPRLSDSMEEGTVLSWMKQVGDEVALGEELVEIETDKANMVFESDAAGTLIEILAEEGTTLPIGEVIARVGEKGEAASGGGEGDDGASGGDGEPDADASEKGGERRRPRVGRNGRGSSPGRERGGFLRYPAFERIASGRRFGRWRAGEGFAAGATDG